MGKLKCWSMHIGKSKLFCTDFSI